MPNAMRLRCPLRSPPPHPPFCGVADTKEADEIVGDGGDEGILDACDEDGDMNIVSPVADSSGGSTPEDPMDTAAPAPVPAGAPLAGTPPPATGTADADTEPDAGDGDVPARARTKSKKNPLHKISKIVKNWASSPRRLRPSTKKKEAHSGPGTKAVRSKVARTTAGKLASPKTPKRTGCRTTRTKPSTPMVLRRSSGIKKKTILTSEQRELAAIAAKREEANKRRRISRDSFKRLSRSGFEKQDRPAKSEKQLTIPKAPKFTSGSKKMPDGRPPKPSRRHAGHESQPDSLPTQPKQHNMVLRNAYKPIKAKTSLTKPEPFKMSSRLLPSTKKKGSPFKSMANMIQKFSSTPQRYHRPRHDTEYEPQQSETKPWEPTKPVSPKLASRARVKETTVEAQEEREARMMTELKPFRANAFNPAIKDSAGDYGVPRILSKECTIPSTPNFQTQKRAEDRQLTADPAESPTAPAFTARKVPDFSSVTGLPEKRVKPVTVADPSARPTLHSNPIATRMQLRREQEAEEAKQRTGFTANPLPEGAPSLPAVEKKPSTKPSPFNLKSLAMHQRGMENFESKKLQLEEERRQRALFKAQEIKVSEKYVPAKSTKPLTEIKAFAHNSDTRALHRKDFDTKVKQQKTEEQMLSQKLAVDRAATERLEIIKARKEAVHKAKPVPKYTVMKVRASDKLLTEPASPMLGRKRLTSMRA